MKDEYEFDSELFTHDYYEYEQGQKHILVRGRLKPNINFWRDIGASDFILDAIVNGYKVPLYSLPPQSFSYHSKCNNDIIYRELLLSFSETLQGLRENCLLVFA